MSGTLLARVGFVKCGLMGRQGQPSIPTLSYPIYPSAFAPSWPEKTFRPHHIAPAHGGPLEMRNSECGVRNDKQGSGVRGQGIRWVLTFLRSYPLTFHALFSVVSVTFVVKNKNRWAEPTLPAHAASMSRSFISVHRRLHALCVPLQSLRLEKSTVIFRTFVRGVSLGTIMPDTGGARKRKAGRDR